MIIHFRYHLNTDCSYAVSFQVKILHCLAIAYCRNILAISILFLDCFVLIQYIGVYTSQRQVWYNIFVQLYKNVVSWRRSRSRSLVPIQTQFTDKKPLCIKIIDQRSLKVMGKLPENSNLLWVKFSFEQKLEKNCCAPYWVHLNHRGIHYDLSYTTKYSTCMLFWSYGLS